MSSLQKYNSLLRLSLPLYTLRYWQWQPCNHRNNQELNSSLTSRESLVTLWGHPVPSPSDPWHSLICLLLPFLECNISEIIQYTVWLLKAFKVIIQQNGLFSLVQFYEIWYMIFNSTDSFYHCHRTEKTSQAALPCCLCLVRAPHPWHPLVCSLSP